jgi:hypothetical protein
MAITCTVIADQAIMLLSFDYTVEAGTQTSLTLTRTVDGVETPLITYGLLCEQGYYYDTTMPLDVPVTYTATTDDAIVDTCTDTVPSGGFVWFKDPGRPWANLRLDLCAVPTPPATPDCDPPEDAISLVQFGIETRPGDFGLFPVLDAERPIDVWARRKDVITSVRFASRTCEAVDEIYTLFTGGGPILIQAPPAYCWPDRFVQPGDLVMEYVSPDQRKPWRVWDVPLTVVDSPLVLGIQGTECANWCDIQDSYATWADLTATALTWGEIASGDALC